MSERRPGAGSGVDEASAERKRPVVVVTRPRRQARSMIEDLEAAGVSTWLVPSIEIVAPADPGPLRDALSAFGSFDWVVFTSPNAVRAVASEVSGLDVALPRIAAVGPSTAREVTELLAASVDLVPPSRYSAAGLAEAFRSGVDSLTGARILLPLGNLASDELEAALGVLGASVRRVEAYRTAPPEPADVARLKASLESGSIDLVTFTSPSTVENFRDALGGDVGGMPVAVIGPVTAEAARDAGCRVLVEASEHTASGLVAAVLAHLHRGDRSR